tara:strand:- start:846 stop:1439 length:594 start_codon:yes stop_codon:yes gene_type:complete
MSATIDDNIVCNVCEDDDTCPICLLPFGDNDNILSMPICGHKIHTKCELKAAQYDSRCPLCRTKDPEITSRQDDDVAMYTNLENLANEHAENLRKYQRKRSRILKKHSHLGKLRDKLKSERKAYDDKERELEKHWMNIQRITWNSDPNIVRLKDERKKLQRKSNQLYRKLEKELLDKCGPKPDTDGIIFNVTLNQMT